MIILKRIYLTVTLLFVNILLLAYDTFSNVWLHGFHDGTPWNFWK